MKRLAVVLALAAAFLAGASVGINATRGAEASAPRPVLQLVPLRVRETDRASSVAPAGRTAAPVPVAPSATPEPEPPTSAPAASLRLRGTASWYPAGSTDAAAGPALRAMLGKGWRGATVRVCNAQRACTAVTLTDWCQCYRGTDTERLIDLPVDAFRELAPLSRGLVMVTVEVAG